MTQVEERLTVLEQPEETNDEMENMYLCFTVGNENYGVEIRHVLQIIGMQEITVMPEMPHEMKGFINLRGSIIPVVSMRVRLGRGECDYTERTCIVIVKVGEKQIGMIVDSIQEAVTIDPELISPPPSVGGGKVSSYLKGVAKQLNDRPTILLLVQELFCGRSYG